MMVQHGVKREVSFASKCFLGVVALMMFCGSTGFVGATEDTLSTDTLLNKMIGAYKDLKSFYGEGLITIKMTAEGATQSMDIPTSIALERPNKFRVSFNHPQMGFEIITDGNNLYSYLSGLAQYRKLPAPATIAEIDLGKVIAPGAQSSGVLGLILSPEPKKYLLEGTINTSLLSPVELEGKQCYNLQLNQQGKVKTNMFIDQKTFLIRQINVNMTEALKEEMAQDKSLTRKPPADLEYTFTEKYNLLKINESLPPEVFKFIEPKGAKEVAMFSPSVEAEETNLSGKMAPDFTLTALDGTKYTLSAQKGKVVLLDFWATWCSPCVKLLPDIQKLYKEYKDKGLVVWGINSESDESRVKKMMEKAGITYPTLKDPDSNVAGLYNVRAIPRTIVIDKSGKIVKDSAGFSGPQTIDEIETAVKEALAEK
ncbi:MAG: redoxin domain-containing protein [Candidatus Sumerlaeia bacterium]|nr:redoxin domain-containing protein [Candidatus Sumerlaeia bacterium]